MDLKPQHIYENENNRRLRCNEKIGVFTTDMGYDDNGKRVFDLDELIEEHGVANGFDVTQCSFSIGVQELFYACKAEGFLIDVWIDYDGDMDGYMCTKDGWFDDCDCTEFDGYGCTELDED